jgi:hypothetical protein
MVITPPEFDILDRFQEASADLLESRALQHRVDWKYLVPARLLGQVLVELRAGFHVVKVADRPLARYDTVYFDTPERQLYHDHRRGRRPRHKVRIRHHVDRCATFLEVKCKLRPDRTLKERLELPFRQGQLDGEARRFVDALCPVDAASLIPCVSIAFQRVTLAGVATDERITFDLGIDFHERGSSERLPDVVIAEVKQAPHLSARGAVNVFRRLNLREQTISKYCLATARLQPVQMNAFMAAFRAVERTI